MLEKRQEEKAEEAALSSGEDSLDVDILKNNDDTDDGEVSNGRFRTDEQGRPDYGKGKINQYYDKLKAYIANVWESKFARDY